jgi:hypothetical protein
VPTRCVHEQLERVERARAGRRSRDDPGLLGLRAHEYVALLESSAQRAELVLAQLVLVRERLQLALVDVAALGGLLDQAVGRREIVQMDCVVQWNPLLSRGPLP